MISVSTDAASVAVQFRVREVPSYSGPVGTLTDTTGVGTAGMSVCGSAANNERDLLTFDGDIDGR